MTVTATDRADNKSEIKSFTFEVDTTAPKPKLTQKKTNELQPTLPLETEPDTEKITKVTFTPKNGGLPTAGTASRNPDTGKWEVTPNSPLTEGTEYDVAVDAEDNVGNKTTKTTGHTAGTITVDQTPPEKATVKKLTKKSEESETLAGKDDSGKPISERNPDIFFDVPDQDTEFVVVDIKKKDGPPIKEGIKVTKGTDGKWKLSTSEQGINLEDGDYTITVVKTVDEAGNENEEKTTFELKVVLEDPNSSGYVLGGCSTTPTTPAEGLLPLLLSALGVGFLRRRKK